MSEKDSKQSLPTDDEQVLDFEQAKELTVGQVERKQNELKAGVTESDSALDRYIKQHRKDIEADKFETKILEDLPKQVEADVQEAAVESPSVEPAVESESNTELTQEFAIHKVTKEMDTVPVSDQDMPAPETAPFNDFEDFGPDEESGFKKTKWIIWGALAVIFAGAVGGTYLWMNGDSSSNTTASSTSQSSTTSSSTSEEESEVVAFNELYASFFTDEALTKLKNSQFEKLSDLQTALEAIDKDSDAYVTAKEKYDNLAAAIAAIKEINGQFDTDLIVDGELGTTATAKEGASFTAATTGIDSVDALITSAINFGRSQLTAASSAVAASSSVAAAETPSSSSDTSTVASVSGSTTGYGIAVPAGVTLQRELSRVPYNQAAIDDSSNSAWIFGEGILENIISISQQRGYISGDNYILEKVNIINGNGYYNLFKPDGTYLFSINCKTGYFVGNGSGHADALDY